MVGVVGPSGLDPGHERVYRLVLARPGITVGEVAAALGRPLDDVRRAVRHLLRDGLLVDGGGAGGDTAAGAHSHGALRAAAPAISLTSLAERERAGIDRRQAQARAAAAALPSLAAHYAAGRRDPAHGPLLRRLDPGAVPAVVADLLGGFDGTPCAVLDETLTPLGRISSRSARIVLSADVERAIPAQRRQALARSGALVRVLAAPPGAMLVLPERAAVIAAPGGAAVVVTARAMVAAAMALFESVWSASQVSLPAAPAGDDPLLGLLVAGLSDEAVASASGVSIRTVRRRVADLLTVLDARTRFQAGVEAARRGLV